jgi:phosphate starvation-inducible PhoH-like protein
MSGSGAAAVELEPADNERLSSLCGPFNRNLKQLEAHFGVEVAQRGNRFQITGAGRAAQDALRVLTRLYEDTATDPYLSPEKVRRVLQETIEPEGEERMLVRTPKRLVNCQNVRQRAYVRAIRGHDISFGIGPAGTGKTYLAVACATEALSENDVSRIVLVRPAVEAGERLGFLPGDIGQKVDPYLRPLYDALYELMGFDKTLRLLERNIIELAPLAFMRGRTLNDAFVILDEAQNTTPEQMKMFLTRIGFGSRAVITGDLTQTDLPRGAVSGLRHAGEVLENLAGISFTVFKPRDVVRHPLVQRIVEAYERRATAGADEMPDVAGKVKR